MYWQSNLFLKLIEKRLNGPVVELKGDIDIDYICPDCVTTGAMAKRVHTQPAIDLGDTCIAQMFEEDTWSSFQVKTL